jgi:hypothetical protein
LDRAPLFRSTYSDIRYAFGVPFDVPIVTDTTALVDPDGDVLVITALIAGEADNNVTTLPPWLVFTNSTSVSRIAGAAPFSAIGRYRVAIIATGGSLSVATSFQLEIIGTLAGVSCCDATHCS